MVVGGGVAGCGAAWAAARAGAQVTMVESTQRWGGAAMQANHQTLCGLAPIDADQPEILNPQWSVPFLEQVASGPAVRRGRVWLWPSSGQHLADGLQRLLADCQRIVGIVDSITSDGQTIQGVGIDGARYPCDGLIDASGGPALAQLMGLDQRPARQWGALRGLIRLPADLAAAWQDGDRQRVLRRCYGVAAGSGSYPAVSLEMVSAGEWQLGMDVGPGTVLFDGLGSWQRLTQELGAVVVQEPVRVVSRDEGGYCGDLTVDQLFAQEEAGLGWAAWPVEWHDQHGVRWQWPPRPYYGVPSAITRPLGGPRNLWVVGKGMPVSAEAMAALRVTGSAWSIGAACGERVLHLLNSLRYCG